ncbi:hypothetical protein D9M71_707720 [compost metagenome]
MVEVAPFQAGHRAFPCLPRGTNRSQEQHAVVGCRVANEVARIRQLASVARRHDQVLATLPAIRPDSAKVLNSSLPGVEQNTVLVARWNFHDQRSAVLQVEITERVDDVVVARL